jgi:hypothetical protein
MRVEWFTGLAAFCVACGPVDWGQLCVRSKSRPLPHCGAGDPAVESEERRSQAIVGALFESFVTPVRYVRYAPRLQIVLARDVLFKHII